ncbi:MAG: DUF4982 domain-containing protein [Parasporobacterium sp.]|nr:DUF4982 domain-containing protein [Parasporobacterium sp.]
MKKTDFQNDWQWRKLPEGSWQHTDLPHDAAMTEPRVQGAPGGVNTGWFLGGDYEYRKTFTVPVSWQELSVIVEFEGVYHNAEVFVNGQKAAARPYGYTNFYVNIKPFLRYDSENIISVIARNSDQPNSRWYSGAGIYRPVWLWTGPEKHIEINGIKIDTLSVDPAVISVQIETTAAGDVTVLISRNNCPVTSVNSKTNGRLTLNISVPDALLWSPDSPNLYTLQVIFGDDQQEISFGIRTLSCNAETGFCINGKRIILRGTCIHHDNGILGARCFFDAEFRKVRLLKENGFNAIRSAHNPCSKYLLQACDQLGMLLVDEYADMWYIHKTKYDYAGYLEQWYEQDITDMVNKDYNHPSVIMYSMGNEVAETGEKRGIELFSKMQTLCHRLDPSRPVTAGVNTFFNYLYSLGLGQYSDEKAEKNPDAKTGSAFFNYVAGLTGASFMKTMARLPGCDRTTRDCYSIMDAAGYNYGLLRYRHDLRKYPDRVILGTETFCSDAYTFWELAKMHPALIGDFIWAGIDYLGETGVGAWEYKQYAPDFTHGVGWMTAGAGRIDLIGNPLGEALYTGVAFEELSGPQIAVRPVNHYGERHSPSAWKFTDAIPSWSWTGCEGRKALVEVYTRAEAITLYLNGKKVRTRKRGRNCRICFNITYHSGTLTAVETDKEGREISRASLETAGKETILNIIPEEIHNDLCFIHLDLTDKNGILKPTESGNILVSVSGGKLLALGSACPYEAEGYDRNVTKTYYGRAMAVVKKEDRCIRFSAIWNYTAYTKVIQ